MSSRKDVIKKIKIEQERAAIEVARKALEELGITPQQNKTEYNKRSDVSDYDIGLLYFLGYSPGQIAAQYGMTAEGIKNRLKRAGIYEPAR